MVYCLHYARQFLAVINLRKITEVQRNMKYHICLKIKYPKTFKTGLLYKTLFHSTEQVWPLTD